MKIKTRKKKLPKPYYETKLGKLYHGDCLDIMPLLCDEVDLVLTDPPYGVGVEYGKHYEDTFENWIKLTENWLPIGLEISNTGLIMTPGGVEQEKFLWINNAPKWRVCWYKGATNQRSPIGFKHWESVFIYGETKSQCGDYLFEIPHVPSNDHPAPKPVGYYEWFIKNFTSEGMLVLDPFCGTETFAVACERFNRRWIGIELGEEYCAIAARKIESEVRVLESTFFKREPQLKKIKLKQGVFFNEV